MRDVIEKYTKEDQSNDPVFIVFINDGGVKENLETTLKISLLKLWTTHLLAIRRNWKFGFWCFKKIGHY